jgi:hypothetical protein
MQEQPGRALRLGAKAPGDKASLGDWQTRGEATAEGANQRSLTRP